MAASNENSEATQVLLVDPQSLPVLLQSNSRTRAGDISVDLLQQALQGASAIEDGEDGGCAEEVSLDALSSGNGDVVTIYQGEEGQTHTIKISLAEAESLGLRFTDERSSMSMNSNSLLSALKVTALSDPLAAGSDSSHSISLSDNMLQNVACSNLSSEGRMIDEEGNIVETNGTLQILPTSLTTFLDDGVSQALSIIPQYELDGSVTYAVRLKDQNDGAFGTDYHVLEPDSSAKTGLDIEHELKNASLKQNILQSAGNLGLGAAVALSDHSNAVSSSIHVPINALDALSKQMLLPVTSTSVPISVTLPMSSDTSVVSQPRNLPSSSGLASSSSGRIFQLVDSSAVGMNNPLATDNSAAASLNALLPQPIISADQQQSQYIDQSSTMLTLHNTAPVSLCAVQRPQILSNKLSGLLAQSPKHTVVSSIKTGPTSKKMPLYTNVGATATTSSTSTLLTARTSVVNTTQPSSANVSKSPAFANSRTSSSNVKSSKPLGSSENPIQLVQQGQTFHSMQALSDAQLRQIATVLQQKHLNSNSTTSKNVLFDEQTKTRIVYRVVYPEDVDLQQPSSPIGKAGSSFSPVSKGTNKSKGRRGKTKRGRKGKPTVPEKNLPKADESAPLSSLQTLNEREVNTPSDIMSKVERKKTVGSRTRSGRVSRPPKHMMKDYKRLHHVDYKDRDIDDSDGGYSDYSNPEQAPEKLPEKPMQEIDLDITPAKKRMSRFTCPTCKRLYLGLTRMEKHFLQHPDHGSFEEFKQVLFASTPSCVNHKEVNLESTEDKELINSSVKSNILKGKKRSQIPNASEKERSETRKKKLRQALQACEIGEVMEVAGPLIARYCTLWDLLLLRLHTKDESSVEEDSRSGNSQNHEIEAETNEGNFDLHSLNKYQQKGEDFLMEPTTGQKMRSTSNRVQWLLMELRSLAETLQSMARDLFQPVHMHGNDKTQVEICEKTVSELFGVSCGTYSVNEQLLSDKIETFNAGFRDKMCVDLDLPPEKRSKKADEAGVNSALNQKGTEMCPENISGLSMIVKPVETDKVMLAKLTEDMPFLNSSDDMLCVSEDPDLSTDSKRDQDCDAVAGMQVVDDIVNERLKNLSENMNFSVQLPDSLANADIKRRQSGLHIMSTFSSADNSISVSNSSVISSSLTEGSKSTVNTVNVSNLDLMSSYSMSSLSPTVSGAHDVNISNSETSNDLASALEPVTGQSMLGSFAIGLPSLSSFDALQSQSSNVSHSDDSFLDSLSSFETPLAQSCSSATALGSSYDDGVMKSSSMLEIERDSSEPRRLPPKFISSFTPAITNDKTAPSISTAQRLQRSYLELESGLDDGLDLDFEALTEELSMSRNNRL